jgi:hypothetical protein
MWIRRVNLGDCSRNDDAIRAVSMTSRATGQQVKGSFDQWQTTFLVPVPGVHRRKQALPAGPASVLLHIDNKFRS